MQVATQNDVAENAGRTSHMLDARTCRKHPRLQPAESRIKNLANRQAWPALHDRGAACVQSALETSESGRRTMNYFLPHTTSYRPGGPCAPKCTMS